MATKTLLEDGRRQVTPVLPFRGRAANWWRIVALGILSFAAVGGMVATYIQARHSTSDLHFTLFWLSMFVALAATFSYVRWLGTSDRATLVILTGYGVFTYLPKFLMSVNGPVWFDEYGQWRHANDILRTGSLFPSSTYLPVLKYYPGLGLLTDGVHEVTRLSTWHSGQVVILCSHTLSVVLVYLIARRLDLESYWAFLAALIFSLNSSFLYFDTQFAYESLGISLALSTVYFGIRLRTTPEKPRCLSLAPGLLTSGYCVITHHISTFMMLLWLLLVAIFVPGYAQAQPSTNRFAKLAPWGMLAWSSTLAGLWLGLVGRSTLSYLFPHFASTWAQVLTLIGLAGGTRIGSTGGSGMHIPFAAAVNMPDTTAPIYEHVAGFVAPLIVLALALVFLTARLRTRTIMLYRWSAPFALLVAAYFVSLPVSLTSAGGEAAHRSFAFTALGIAIIGSLAFRDLSRTRLINRTLISAVITAACIGILCMGNIAAGEDPLYRFPGPFLLGATSRAANPSSLQLATWIRRHLPASVKILADHQVDEIITGYTYDNGPSPTDGAANAVYLTGPQLDIRLQRILKMEGFRYFVLNTDVEREVPVQGLFSGYHSYSQINPVALTHLGANGYFYLLHTAGPYRLYAIHLQGGPGPR